MGFGIIWWGGLFLIPYSRGFANVSEFSENCFASRLGQNQTTPTWARYMKKAWHPKFHEIYFRDQQKFAKINVRKNPAIWYHVVK